MIDAYFASSYFCPGGGSQFEGYPLLPSYRQNSSRLRVINLLAAILCRTARLGFNKLRFIDVNSSVNFTFILLRNYKKYSIIKKQITK
jgi:hypothetical protein